MTESNNISESNEKSDYYENKIQRLTNELEIQNQKRNQEMEELFEEIETENTSLKKELIQTKEELEQEKDKTNNIKNSIYNFNYYQNNINNFLKEKQPNIIENKNNEENNIDYNYNYNSSLFCDNIKLIKEEKSKKLLELTKENENKIKTFEKNWKNFEKKIQELYVLSKNNNIYDKSAFNNKYNEILNEVSNYYNKINGLLNDDYSNKKYSIILQEKLELAKEEIIFLKERIIQEKRNIIEKINEVCRLNNLTHLNITREIINEINSKRKNYFNDQFYIPFYNLHQILLESKDNEKELKNKITKLQKEFDDLNFKYETINEQKNKLLENASNNIIEKEKDKTNDLILTSQINKLRKEKQILENEINSLLKNNNELNEQILTINNKIQYELLKEKKNNEILLIQKNDMINELNTKITDYLEKNLKDKKIIEELNNEIIKLKNNINEYANNEGNYKNEIISLKKRVKETEMNYKTTLNQTNTMDSINRTFTQKLSNLQTEKKSIENKLNVMNNKYNSLVTEKNKMNVLINDYRNKNNELELLNQDLNNRLTITDKNIEDYANEKELLNTIQKAIKQIYQNHIIGDNNVNINISEINMLKEINDKLNEGQNNSNNNQLINVNIIYNEDFASLEQNKNSQLYENILLYIFHIQSQNKIEINKKINNYSELNNNVNNNNNINQILDNLKNELDEKYKKFNERLKYSVNIDEIEQLIGEIKILYESVIESIIQSFFNHKTDLSNNNILTIQLPLEKYDQILNNTSSNLSNIEATLVNKINEYKNQGIKIDNALNILNDNVNNLI